MRIRRHSLGILGAAFIVLAACGASMNAGSDYAVLSGRVCEVTEAARRPLTDEHGRLLYVEPVAFVGGPLTLLAGWPTYLFDPGRGAGPTRVYADSLFGAIISPDGATRTITVPFRSRQLGTVKALPRQDGNWDVVFAQVPSYPDSSLFPPDSADRVWYGVLSPSGWISLDTIPIRALSRRSYGTGHSSRLVRQGDTLYWAFVARREMLRSDIVLMRHLDGQWTARGMAAYRTGYLEMIRTRSHGLVLAAVTPDSTQRADNNSLFLFSWNEGFAKARRLSLGARAATHQPVLNVRGEMLDIIWPAQPVRGRRYQAWAMADVLGSPVDSALVVDDELATPFPPQAVSSGAGPVWITHHAIGRERSQSVLRFSRPHDGRVNTVAEIPTPYLGGFRAVGLPDGVMTTGTQGDTAAGAVWSLLVRYRVKACEGR